jgi:hypothetical protein
MALAVLMLISPDANGKYGLFILSNSISTI